MDTNTWTCPKRNVSTGFAYRYSSEFLLTHLNIYGIIPKIHLMKELETDIIEKGI